MISASVVSGRRVMKITFSPFPGCDDYSLQLSGDEVKIYHKPPRGQFFAHIMTVDRREIEIFLDDSVERISCDSLKSFVEHKKSFITPAGASHAENRRVSSEARQVRQRQGISISDDGNRPVPCSP